MTSVTKTRSDLKRESIISAAKSAFQQFGVASTSMDKLAELAQVSKRTVYNHFSTKEELVMFLLQEMWRKAMVDSDIRFNTDTSLASQLHRLVADNIQFATSDEHMELARVCFGHFFYHPEKLAEQMACFKDQETVMERWVREACEHNALTADNPEHAIEELVSLIKGLVYWPQLMQFAPPLSDADKAQYIERIVAMFMSRYGA